MSSIHPTSVIVTPHYVTGREFNKRLRAAYPSDPATILQLALDLHRGRLVVTDASVRQAKRLARFVAAATEATVSAATHV
jgi:hypothetical protein